MKLESLEISKQKIPVIYEYSDKTKLVSLKLVFKNSGVIANKIAGTSRLLAEILDEGSKKQGSIIFNQKLEQKAIELSFSSGDESFVIELLSLKEHFDFAFLMLCELLAEPNFTDEAFELVKTRTLGEILAKKSDFDFEAKSLLNSMIYANTNFAFAKIGNEESLEKITLQELKSFFDTNLCLDNLFIVLGGNIKLSECDFSKLNIKKRQILEFSPFCADFSPFKMLSNLPTKELKRSSEQAYIYFASPYEVPKDEQYKANVAMFILGSSGFGSKLMEEIRVKRGLAYSVYAYKNFGHFKNGVFGYLQTKNENKDKARELVSEIFRDFVKNGASLNELESAKKFLVGSEALSKETLFKRLNIAQNEHYMGYELGRFDKNLELIKALSLDELNAFIKEHSSICQLSFAVVHG